MRLRSRVAQTSTTILRDVVRTQHILRNKKRPRLDFFQGCVLPYTKLRHNDSRIAYFPASLLFSITLIRINNYLGTRTVGRAVVRISFRCSIDTHPVPYYRHSSSCVVRWIDAIS